MRSAAYPVRFRRRMTLSFVVVAAIAAGVLAVTSFVLVKTDRLDTFKQRAFEKTNLALGLAEARIPGTASEQDLRDLMASLRRRAGIDAMAVADGQTLASSPELFGQPLPEEVVDQPLEQDGFRSVMTDVGGTRYLVVHAEGVGLTPIFFLFSADNLVRQLDQLAWLLLRVWLGVVVVAAVVGHWITRGTLRPIARASEAATDLAEGLLDTRLPTDRHDEFGTWAVSFNRMADALQEKIKELEAAAEREKRFTSDVSHELRTPLSALITSASMLQQHTDELDAEAQWAARQLYDQIRRLRKLVEELLEISRLDAGEAALDLRQVDLRDLVDQLLVHHGWSDRVEADVPHVPMQTDVRRFDRIIGNLVDNALEHGGNGVRLSASAGDGDVRIQVHDDGPGIAARDLPRIFDRFYKSDPARLGGSGLGLAIALQNARLLGGDVAAVPVDEGALFEARLPRTPPADGDEAVT